MKLLIAACCLLAFPASALAYATFEIEVTDPAGVGFNDTTPADPVGGNTETTVGAQRLAALQHAADLWGALIDSEVPIVVDASFEPLGCSGGTVSALGGSNFLFDGVDGDGGDPTFYYDSALADRLMGEDQEPDASDIIITFNADYDQPGCTRWYVGLDSDPGEDVDLVTVALHELGHGLGVSSVADLTTGAWMFGAPGPYDSNLFDRDQGMSWLDLDDAGRASSARNARGLVWDGAHVLEAAPDYLELGAPLLSTTPDLGLSGLIADAEFGARPLAMSVSAPLVLGDPIDGCDPPLTGAGAIVLLRPECRYSQVTQNLEASGALGVLMAIDPTDTVPAIGIEEDAPSAVSGIPVLSLTHADALLLETALASGAVTAEISADGDQLIGADPEGRLYLNAMDPISSKAVAHVDPLARPHALMEPTIQNRSEHHVDLTYPLLRDLGWEPFCGNSRIDQEEECDEGASNDDAEPDACRTDCSAAGCGDGVLDTGESCDDGSDNSDTLADACRDDCMPAGCGDGVTDDGEACDDGEDNSDTEPDACRSDCTEPACGDGVTDGDEGCDDGDANSDTLANGCRMGCVAASCGDGVTDDGESCDDGGGNSDTLAGACRSACMPARCGDGVTDVGESCDDGAANSAVTANACRADCTAARCGDGVVDQGEQCDGTAGCAACMLPATTGGPGGMAGAGAGEGSGGGDSGCGCRAIGSGSASGGTRSGLALAALLFAVAWQARSRARRAPRIRARRSPVAVGGTRT